MTHTLHREGLDQSLRHDFVVFAVAHKSIPPEEAGDRMRRFLETASRFGPVNMGSPVIGTPFTSDFSDFPEVVSRIRDGGLTCAVFDDVEPLARLLQTLRENPPGLSVTVSGLLEEVGECCRRAGLHPRAVNLSLGIFGDTGRLAPDDVREITTMCGHGLITAELVAELVDGIRENRLTPEEASGRMSSLCLCGVFNTTRSAELLSRMAATPPRHDVQ